MKYVIFKDGSVYHPVLFSDHTTHKQVSIVRGKPIAAGTVTFNSIGIPTCSGKSDSLNLTSRGEQDSELIRKMMLDVNMSSFIDFGLDNEND